mgnify:CR=1 FL=1
MRRRLLVQQRQQQAQSASRPAVLPDPVLPAAPIPITPDPATALQLGKLSRKRSAERTRRYRERIDQGVQLVTIPVLASAVYTLARLRFLPDVENVDPAKLRASIADLIRWAAQQKDVGS